MEWLKALLADFIEEEKQTDFIERFSKEFPKHAMPKDKYNEVASELKATKEQLAQTSQSVDELSKKAQTSEELQKSLSELQAKYNEFEKQADERINAFRKQSALKETLNGKVPKSAIDLLVKEADLSAIEIDESGKIKNTDALLESYKSNYSDLFIVENSNSHLKDQQHDQTQSGSADIRAIMGLPT